MAVKVTATFRISDIDDMLAEEEREIEREQEQAFKDVGMKFVSNARRKGEYNNLTFKLRSSIAFTVIRDGKTIYSNYQQVGPGSDGVKDARKLIAELRSQHSKGLVLIVVTAEGYAASVESRNKDVLTGSSFIAIEELRQLFAA